MNATFTLRDQPYKATPSEVQFAKAIVSTYLGVYNARAQYGLPTPSMDEWLNMLTTGNSSVNPFWVVAND